MKSPIGIRADSAACVPSVGTGDLARPSRAQLGSCRRPKQLWIRSIRCLQAVALTVAVLLFMGAGEDSARFKDLGHRMMCTCGCGQVLLECNHVGCQSSDKMRNQLLAALDKGNNDDLILQGFVQEYGPTVIAAPTATGFNRVAWIMPFAALAFGITFVIYVVRSWKNRPAPALADGITIPRDSKDDLDEFRERARKETDL
ncbi:MAG TPA: cytochrome c-type biogenesis protein CcmH [Terriglobales bacterium]|nr:cytochrome c-type biogenesis protein CcmH [Terriglobales bacterium]